MKEFLRALLSYSRRERNGILVLLFLLLLIEVFGSIRLRWKSQEKIDFSPLEKAITARAEPGKTKPAVKLEKDQQVRTIFYFNPNQLPEEKWLSLGLSKKQIAVIRRYEAKGGRFRNKEDVRKMYCISEQTFQRLAPYIVIPQSPERNYPDQSKITKTRERCELNAADSLALLRLPGIGPVLAQRILKFREALGGFYALHQLKEIYALDTSIYQSLTSMCSVDTSGIKKLKINSTGYDALKKHPYLGAKRATLLLNYRNQHGEFTNLQDLQQALRAEDAIFEKLKLYVRFD